jgi:hypothetical protein
MTVKPIFESTSVLPSGNPVRNAIEHYRHYLHNLVCASIIDGNPNMVSPELNPDLTEKFGDGVPDIVFQNEDYTKYVEIKVKHNEMWGDVLSTLDDQMEGKYPNSGIIVFYPMMGKYRWAPRDISPEEEIINIPNLTSVCAMLDDYHMKLINLCEIHGQQEIVLNDLIERNDFNITISDKIFDYIDIERIEPSDLEHSSEHRQYIGDAELLNMEKFPVSKLCLPTSGPKIQYTPLLLLQDSMYLETTACSDQSSLDRIKKVFEQGTLRRIKTGRNDKSRQESGQSCHTSHVEGTISVELLLEMVHMNHDTEFRKKKNSRGSKGSSVSRSMIQCLGIGIKEEKMSYQVILNNAHSYREKKKAKNFAADLDKRYLFQQTYTPLSMTWDNWMEKEMTWLVKPNKHTNLDWYKVGNHPIYNKIDEDAYEKFSDIMVKGSFPRTNLAMSLAKYARTCLALNRSWSRNSKSSIIKTPIVVEAVTGEAFIGGFIIRAPHFSTSVSGIVPLLVVQFFSLSCDFDTKYKKYTVFELVSSGKTYGVAVRRFGTSLLKLSVGTFCHRVLIAPMNALCKATSRPRPTFSRYFKDSVRPCTGEEWFLSLVTEQFGTLLFPGSQMSSFLAEMRKCQMSKTIQEHGSLYKFKGKGNVFAKAQEAVINNPMVFYLVRGWNCALLYPTRVENSCDPVFE